MAEKGLRKKKKEMRRQAKKMINQAVIEHNLAWSIHRHAPAEFHAKHVVRGATSPVRPASEKPSSEIPANKVFSGW